ncbi:hypothetical protein D3C81_920170 [compost metagenome]
MALDLHVLDIGLQRTPELIDQRQGSRIGFGQRCKNDFVAAEQRSIGSLHPALLGAGNRMARHETRQTPGKGLAGCAHDIALGTADVGQHRLPQIEPSQAGEEFFHGQDRHGKLDDISADAGDGEIFFAAVDHAQFHRQLARLRVKVDTDYFAAQAAFTQAFGEGPANQAQPDYHQATDDRPRLVYHDFTHGAGPCSKLHARHS